MRAAETGSRRRCRDRRLDRDEDRERLVAELADKNASWPTLQGETPLMHVCVDGQAIAKVVSDWTGIPVGRMVSDEINAVLNLKERMGERVVGQDHALEAIAQSIRTSRAQLADPRQPIGVFMLVGPSGVGKTETGITLADLLYGGEQNMTVINMSEFKEEHKVSLLMGSPPGYVGYGEGGVLTEAVRRKPYSVVLLDEMEKAHPGVQDIFYQVFDKGTLRDGEGRDIDFKNTVILMTTNAGTDVIMSLCADEETAPDAGGSGQGHARGSAEDLQAGVPRAPESGALLPAGRRRDETHHRPEDEQDPPSCARELPCRSHLRSCAGAACRRSLRRGRDRRAQCRPYPQPYPAARDGAGVPRPHGAGQGGQPGEHKRG